MIMFWMHGGWVVIALERSWVWAHLVTGAFEQETLTCHSTGQYPGNGGSVRTRLKRWTKEMKCVQTKIMAWNFEGWIEWFCGRYWKLKKKISPPFLLYKTVWHGIVKDIWRINSLHILNIFIMGVHINTNKYWYYLLNYMLIIWNITVFAATPWVVQASEVKVPCGGGVPITS